jgi:hypothetical protein
MCGVSATTISDDSVERIARVTSQDVERVGAASERKQA